MNTLYLVSATKKGINYWNVGITQHSNPLDRDKKHYLEVFRAERTHDAHLVELAIARTFEWIMNGARQESFHILEPPAREGLSYDFPIEVPLNKYITGGCTWLPGVTGLQIQTLTQSGVVSLHY
jgi:hypothetical protein